MTDSRCSRTDAKPSLSFQVSGTLFRAGLALVSVEQIRPLGLQLSDYCFFLSAAALLGCSRPRARTAWWMNIATVLILCGVVLSTQNATSWGNALGPLMRFACLFAVFGPLAIAHSREMKANFLALAGGISVNSLISILQASVAPGIVKWISINPSRPDLGDTGRYQGLTTHPNAMGLCTALAVMAAVGMLSLKDSKTHRITLSVVILTCVVGGLLSGSRTTIAALVPALFLFLLLGRPSFTTIFAVCTVVLLLWGTVAYLLPDALSDYSERAAMTGEGNAPDYGRWMTAGLALMEISERPFVGWGVDHFDQAGEMLIPGTDEVAGTHVTFLQYWYGAGLLGGLGFLAVFIVPTVQIIKALKTGPGPAIVRRLHVCVSLLLLLFIVSNLHPLIFNRFLYLPVFLLSGFAAAALADGETVKVDGSNRESLPPLIPLAT